MAFSIPSPDVGWSTPQNKLHWACR